ncbi:MAG TPA: hypothetical protein VKB93_17650 [Thermoanaerobaculia bacterium]|nr:hypothetical protein [Thermoanaerobaculia bacterium]
MLNRRSIAPLLLVLAACASSSKLADRNTLDCEHGEVQVRVGLEGSSIGMERTEDRRMLHVEISNNSREDIVVKAIRVDSIPRMQATYQVDNTYRTFNERIAENGDHEFELPMTGRALRRDPRGQSVDSETPGLLELSVTVLLEGNDSYRCSLLVPAPVS